MKLLPEKILVLVMSLLFIGFIFGYIPWANHLVMTTGTVDSLDEIEKLVPFLKEAQQEAIPMDGPFSYCIAENHFYICIAVTGKMSAEAYNDSVWNDCLYNDEAGEKFCSYDKDLDRELRVFYGKNASLARFNFLDQSCFYKFGRFDRYWYGGYLHVGICEEGCLLYANGLTGRRF